MSRGIKGEALIAEHLGRLPGDYFLLNDVVLRGHHGSIDHVVIGPGGLVIGRVPSQRVFRQRAVVPQT